MFRLKRVLNWETSLKCKLEKELGSAKVVTVKYVVCAKNESCVKDKKGFRTSCIKKTVKKTADNIHLFGL